MNEEKKYCECKDWAPCGCGNQNDGRHCMYCCQLLTLEQLKAVEIEESKMHSGGVSQ